MKIKKVKLIPIVIISIIAIMISIPTFDISFKGKDYKIRGFKLFDVAENNVLGDFSFDRSLGLHGGKRYVYTLSMIDDNLVYIHETTDRVMDIMEARMYYLNIGEYKMYSLTNDIQSQIIIETAHDIDDSIMRKLANRGEVGAWAIDYSMFSGTVGEDGEPIEVDDPYKGTFFEGRKQEDFVNSDIMFASVVSDSRVFISEAAINIFGENEYISTADSKPSNFGLRLHTTPESNIKLLTLLSTNPYGASPIIFTIDGEPVALQASGDVNTNSVPDSVLLYTLGEDSMLYNNSIAAFLSTPMLETQTYLTDTKDILPTGGVNLYRDTFIALSLGYILLQLVWIYYFKKRAKFGVVVNGISILWSVGLLKLAAILGLTLTNSLIYGSWLATFVFISFTALTTYRIRTLSSAGLTKDELESVTTRSKVDFRKLTILFIVVAWVLQRYGDFMIDQFASGMGFGMIAGLGVVLIAYPTILNYTFVTRSHKK